MLFKIGFGTVIGTVYFLRAKVNKQKYKLRRAFSFKEIVGNVRFPAAENFSSIVQDIDELFRLCPFIKILG